jgi:hypothetical protein
MSSLPTIINAAFTYVIDTSKKYHIDESHSLKHSMEVFQYANKIYKSELINFPILEEQKDIIFVSAIIHDMCDKKYMNERKGIENIRLYLKDFMPSNSVDIVGYIISSMSYSKVKVYGFPDLGEYQMAYHIVREADLLSSYDIDRCIMFGMYCEGLNYIDASNRALKLYNERVMNYNKDNLFVTSYSRNKSIQMELKASMNLKLIEAMKDNIKDNNYNIN